MKIYLLDMEEGMCEQWAYFFREELDNGVVEIIQWDIVNFLNETPVQAIVSPANAFGRMDGGYDWFLSDYYKNAHGVDITQVVQEQLMKEYRGEQPVGTAMTVRFEDKPWLIHAPTMRYPRRIEDGEIIINCMRMVLNECVKNGIESVVIPAFGGGVGEVAYWNVALLMKIGLINFCNPIDASNWDNIYNRLKEELSYKETLGDDADAE